MRRTLRICRNAWTRFGNYPDNSLPALPLFDDGGEGQDCCFPRGLGCYPNKQKQRFPALPETAVSSLCGNKDTACEVTKLTLMLWDSYKNVFVTQLLRLSIASKL